MVAELQEETQRNGSEVIDKIKGIGNIPYRDEFLILSKPSV